MEFYAVRQLSRYAALSQYELIFFWHCGSRRFQLVVVLLIHSVYPTALQKPRAWPPTSSTGRKKTPNILTGRKIEFERIDLCIIHCKSIILTLRYTPELWTGHIIEKPKAHSKARAEKKIVACNRCTDQCWPCYCGVIAIIFYLLSYILQH